MAPSKGYRDLIVYKKAFALAMEIFRITKGFPKEEKYSLTDQIRRSSRSVCTTIAEAYRKRKYEAYFVSKATDADGENSETIVWLEFALGCEYLVMEEAIRLESQCDEIGRMLNTLIESPQKFLPIEKKRN